MKRRKFKGCDRQTIRMATAVAEKMHAEAAADVKEEVDTLRNELALARAVNDDAIRQFNEMRWCVLCLIRMIDPYSYLAPEHMTLLEKIRQMVPE